jgi:hypothetical protein
LGFFKNGRLSATSAAFWISPSPMPVQANHGID